MRRSKNLLKKAAAVAMMATMVVGSTTTSAFAYGEGSVKDSSFNTFKTEGTEYDTWNTDTWSSTKKDSGKIALTPGSTEKDLNFAWYSETKATPAVKVWKDGQKASAAVVKGTATGITASNQDGVDYTASNKVSITDYFEGGTTYYYQYTDNYTGKDTDVWSTEEKYKASKSDSFSVILTGDPQIGASGNESKDTYNWNKTMQTAVKNCPEAAFLLSAGDQIDQSTATGTKAQQRETQYAGYLYPSVFRNLPIAATIGNHDMSGVDYTQHFNNPNSTDASGKQLGATEAGGDFYFSYGDVLFISLNSSNRNQAEHRTAMTNATNSNPTAKWKVVIFHSDIYGSGSPHADSDATANRVILAPLMDEFDIDICLTGHDHTYSRSYQILDGNVIDYDITSGSVTDPEGTLYITTGSGSGSKYYDLLNYTPYYIAERTNACLPAYSTIDFSSGALVLKTFDYTGTKYAADFTIKKTTNAMSVDEVIANAQTTLAGDLSGYTDDSVAALKTAVTNLSAMKAAYTTAADPMIELISNDMKTMKYIGKEDSKTGAVTAGYGQVRTAYRDAVGTERLKEGMSTLLDKTVYTQIESGVKSAQLANYTKANAPIVSAAALEEAKTAVVTAINGLAEKPAAEPTPQTGDSAPMRILALGMSMMAAIAAAGVVLFRKKEDEICEK